MKNLTLSAVLALALVGCSEEEATAPADIAAGKAIAETQCVGCHGLDGAGTAPGIPNMAAQVDRYLLESLQAYDFPTEARIFSNMSEGVYLLTRQQVHDSFYDPTAGFAGFATSEYLEANHAAWEWGEQAYLVWFKPNEKNYYFTPKQLGTVFQMVVEFSMDGGNFFRVTNR
ncbi:MAG: c-type cytochrome [Pseudomonadota bacterium]